MNYNELSSSGKFTSDGEQAKKCNTCDNRCYVFYDEEEKYHVECEKCGVVLRFKARNKDKAIRVWNITSSSLRDKYRTKSVPEKEQAIGTLTSFRENVCAEKLGGALDLAIKSLEESESIKRAMKVTIQLLENYVKEDEEK